MLTTVNVLIHFEDFLDTLNSSLNWWIRSRFPLLMGLGGLDFPRTRGRDRVYPVPPSSWSRQGVRIIID